MEFLQDLNEARMVVSKQHLKKYTAKDVADLAFLHLLTLHLFKQEFYTRPFAINYAQNTFNGGNFMQMRADRTDLYNLLYVLIGHNNEDAVKKLKAPKESEAFLETLYVNKMNLRQYLRLVAQNKSQPGWERRFLLQMQHSLNIDTPGYRALRQMIANYNVTNYEQKRLAITRLLMAYRARAMRSDMHKRLEKYARQNRLEIKDEICNPETGKGCGKAANRQAVVQQGPKKQGTSLGKTALVAAGLAGAYMWGKSQGDKE
jgi:hypothetical protein